MELDVEHLQWYVEYVLDIVFIVSGIKLRSFTDGIFRKYFCHHESFSVAFSYLHLLGKFSYFEQSATMNISYVSTCFVLCAL